MDNWFSTFGSVLLIMLKKVSFLGGNFDIGESNFDVLLTNAWVIEWYVVHHRCKKICKGGDGLTWQNSDFERQQMNGDVANGLFFQKLKEIWQNLIPTFYALKNGLLNGM